MPKLYSFNIQPCSVEERGAISMQRTVVAPRPGGYFAGWGKDYSTLVSKKEDGVRFPSRFSAKIEICQDGPANRGRGDCGGAVRRSLRLPAPAGVAAQTPGHFGGIK